jgi:DNA-binding transcriptional LysR family regulator
VSQQISRLERELGTRLFDRTSRRVALSPAGERLLPVALAALTAVARVGEVAADLASGADAVLRLGTSQGLGERLERVLAAVPVPVRLRSAAQPERLAAVRSGELDAAFVRVVTAAPGLELLPVWSDPLVVALPAAHPLAAAPELALPELADLPVRLAPRDRNPAFHDLVTGAGVALTPGPSFDSLTDCLAEIGTGAPAWTVLYAAAAEGIAARRVVFRPLAGLAAVTSLAVPPGPPTPVVRHLLAACADVVQTSPEAQVAQISTDPQLA